MLADAWYSADLKTPEQVSDAMDLDNTGLVQEEESKSYKIC